MAPIIHPWDFHGKYSVDARRTKVTCRFLPLQFVVSYQDLLLAMDIGNSLKPLGLLAGIFHKSPYRRLTHNFFNRTNSTSRATQGAPTD